MRSESAFTIIAFTSEHHLCSSVERGWWAFRVELCPAKPEPCWWVTKVKWVRPSCSCSSITMSVPQAVCTIVSGSWAPRFDHKANKCPAFWSLLDLLIPSLSQDYSRRERSNIFNSIVTLLNPFCNNPGSWLLQKEAGSFCLDGEQQRESQEFILKHTSLLL